jgi:hypothetical protein
MVSPPFRTYKSIVKITMADPLSVHNAIYDVMARVLPPFVLQDT